MKAIQYLLLLSSAVFTVISCHDPAGLGGISNLSGNVSIDDQISDQPSNGPAKKARIDVFFEYVKAVPDFSTYTNERGEYSVFGLSKGNYWVRASMVKPLQSDSLFFVSHDEFVEIPKDGDFTTLKSLSLKYFPGTDLWVKVVAPSTGDPVAFVPVYLFNHKAAADSAFSDPIKLISVIAQQTSRKDGTIFLRNLPVSKYYGVVNIQDSSFTVKGFGESGPINPFSINTLTVEIH
jgi:hypothetical protein